MRRSLAVLGACLAGLLLPGCGGAGPRLASAGRQARAVARANATHEYPAPTPSEPRAAGAAGPAQAVAAFARAYINWNAGDVAATMVRLARLSIGQARSEMALAAAETRVDASLHQGRIANHGTVEAVARLRGSRDRFVVVTREQTTSSESSAYQGLAPAWHLTLATVAAEPDAGARRWVVSGWQPES